MAVGLFQPAGNPAPNPAGFAQAASGIFDTLQQAAAAAQRQQVQLQHQSLKDAFDQELKLRQAGYTPYLQTTGQTSSGLKTRQEQNVDPSRVVTDPFGRKWVAPAAQQTFSDTTNLLEKGARPVDAAGNVPQMQQVPRLAMDLQGALTDTGRFGINAAPPAGTTVTPPGSSQAYFVPGEEEKAGLKARLEAQAAAAKPGTPTVDTEHFSTPVSIDHKTGKVTALQLPDGVTHNEKPEKTSKYTFSYHTDDNGTVHVLRGDPDTGEVEEIKKVAGAGAKRKDPDAPGGETPAERNAQRRRDAAQKQIETWQAEEQKTHGVRQAYADVIWDPASGKEIADGEKVIDPRTGAEVLMNAARRAYYKRQFQNATEKVTALQERQKATVQRFGGEAGGSQAAPAAAKAASMDQVKAYLAEKQKTNPRFTLQQAVREFNDAGYKIGGN